MKKKVLKGKKVYLRGPEKGDCAEYITMSRRSEKFHRGLIKMSRTEEEFDRFIERASHEAYAGFIIFRAADDAVAGMINLSQIFYGPFCNAYLGYGLGTGFTGEGLMAEAVELILKHSFTGLKLHRVEANVQPENLPSIAVLKRNGFSKEGYSKKYLKIGGKWRDHERWAIVREDWSEKRRNVEKK